MRDYLAVNRKHKKHISYSLSPDTAEALELLRIARRSPISHEDEERVKLYLLCLMFQDGAEEWPDNYGPPPQIWKTTSSRIGGDAF